MAAPRRVTSLLGAAAPRASPSARLYTPSLLLKSQLLGRRPPAVRLLHLAARSSPHSPIATSSLPKAFLAARIRSRCASTEAGKEVAAAAPKAQALVEEKEEDKASSKIKLGEVRRLAQLAKPERKTIAIAIGLVSSRSLMIVDSELMRLLCGPAALRLVICVTIDPVHHWTHHRPVLWYCARPPHLCADCRWSHGRLLRDQRLCQSVRSLSRRDNRLTFLSNRYGSNYPHAHQRTANCGQVARGSVHQRPPTGRLALISAR